MKIAYDPQIFSFQVYGGVSRYICEIASNISASHSQDIKIVAPFFVCKYLEKLNNNLIMGFKAPNFAPLSLFFRFCSMVIGHIYLLLHNPRIIHETYFFPYALGSKKAKRVLTVHDMIHEKFASPHFLWDRASKYKLLAVNRADHIICISEATKRDLIDLFGVDEEKISVIYHGYSINLKINEIPLVGMKLPSRYLLYVGHRGGYKNFKGFLEAYAASSAIKQDFDIVCFGGNDLSKAEVDMCIQLGIAPNKISYLSGGDDVLFHLYQNAAAFIFPSIYEGFGLPPLEAMSNDCVVICSNAASIPEVVGNAGEYFDPNDMNDIKRAMENVLLQPIRSEELKVLGRERVKHFSWERCASETMKLYTKLAASS